jgi:hypothetical protein
LQAAVGLAFAALQQMQEGSLLLEAMPDCCVGNWTQSGLQEGLTIQNSGS